MAFKAGLVFDVVIYFDLIGEQSNAREKKTNITQVLSPNPDSPCLFGTFLPISLATPLFTPPCALRSSSLLPYLHDLNQAQRGCSE